MKGVLRDLIDHSILLKQNLFVDRGLKSRERWLFINMYMQIKLVGLRAVEEFLVPGI